MSALLWCAVALAGAGQLPLDLGERLTQGYVSGAMQRFEQATARLAYYLNDWCASLGDTGDTGDTGDIGDTNDVGRERVRDGFAATVESWSAIEFLRFGPLVQANRFERIFFWPDPRGVTLRQVQGLLAGPTEIAGNAQALFSRSVALQGLPALEYVLYRDGGLLADEGERSERDGAFAVQCAYASAVGQNLAERGRELAAAWRSDAGYAALFARPGPDNPVYRSQREVAGEAVKSLSTGLQFLREVKLVPVVGSAPDARRARRAPFWRSGLTARSLHAGVVGLRAFLQAGDYRYGPGEVGIGEHLDGELARAERLLAGMQAPVAAMLADPDSYRQLQLVILLLGNAKHILDEDMAPAFGVTIGFNALDGD